MNKNCRKYIKLSTYPHFKRYLSTIVFDNCFINSSILVKINKLCKSCAQFFLICSKILGFIHKNLWTHIGWD